MRNSSGYKPFIALFIALFFSMTLSEKTISKLRLFAVCSLSLPWATIHGSPPQEKMDLIQIDNEGLLPAQLSFRSPDSWNSSIWINVGKNQNREKLLIAKNSPVLADGVLIGVVEYVGQSHSRVRLITDSALSISVCTASKEVKQRKILNLVQQLETLLKEEGKCEALTTLARQVKAQPSLKGELLGSSSPMWRAKSKVLKGMIFNTDSAVETPKLHVGDLLLTTGYDGIFPEGLQVGVVCDVGAIREGAASYSFEAKPAALDLNEIKLVFVMPPLGFIQDEQESK